MSADPSSAIAPDAPAATADPPASCRAPELLDAFASSGDVEAMGEALSELPGEWPRVTAQTFAARVTENEDAWQRVYAQACADGDAQIQRCLDAKLWEAWATAQLIATGADRRGSELWSAVDVVLADAEGCRGADRSALVGEPLPPAAGVGFARLWLLTSLGELDRARDEVTQLRQLGAVEGDPSYGFYLRAFELVVEVAGPQPDLARVDTELAALREVVEPHGRGGEVVLAQIEARRAIAAGDVVDAIAKTTAVLELDHGGTDPWSDYWQLLLRGHLEAAAGQLDDSAASLMAAIALANRLRASENPQGALAQRTLADQLATGGHLGRAHDLYLQARDGFATSLGADHPETLEVVGRLGSVLLAAGQPADAQFAFSDLVAIHAELFGDKDPRTAAAKVNLGDALTAMDEHRGANQMYAEAIVPLTDALGAEHPHVIHVLAALGRSELRLGAVDLAETHCTMAAGLARGVSLQEGPTTALIAECVAAVEKANKAKKPKKAGRRGRKNER